MAAVELACPTPRRIGIADCDEHAATVTADEPDAAVALADHGADRPAVRHALAATIHSRIPTM